MPIFSLRMFYNSVGVSGAYFYIAWMFYNSVGVSGWPIFTLLGCSSYNSVGVSGWPIFTLLGCSITVWVCLGGLFLHCSDVL